MNTGTLVRTGRRWPRLWWVPLVLALAPLVGLAPAPLDIPGFFAPMREATAAALAAGEAPWLNWANGCGEAWFANPETGVLYPPHLLYAFLPLSWALSAEVAIHLAWLSLGTGLLAVAWGARRRGRIVVEVAAWSCGPALSTVGVINNLDALSWLPWMVLAACRSGRAVVPLLAAATALGWLAGEPQVWALGVALAIFAAPRRTIAVLGVMLGLALVAVQVGPFAAWVVDGDRGPDMGETALAGAVSPRGWAGVVMPGVPSARAGARVYVASLFLGAPLVLAVVLGALRRWRLALLPLMLMVLATLPEVGLEQLYLALTRGLVRYPSRFAVVALVCLIPLAGSGVDLWLAGKGRRLAWILVAATLIVTVWAPSPLALVAGALPALMLMAATLAPSRGGLRAAALLTTLGVAVAVGWQLLGLGPAGRFQQPERAWPEVAGAERVYAPSPDLTAALWISEEAGHGAMWPAGYANLRVGMRVAQSPAPVRQIDLAEHVRKADSGNRWWQSSLAAPWVILPTAMAPAGLVPVRQRSGLWLYRNPKAWSVATLSADRPSPGAGWRGAGGVVTLDQRPDRLRVAVTSQKPGWLCLALAPVRGWRWQLDGEEVEPQRCAGILQAVPLAAGAHRFEGWYRPPLLVPGAWVSGVALALLLALTAGSLRRSAGAQRRIDAPTAAASR